MKIYIDISMFFTNFFRNKYLSGIQRVVKEVTECFLDDSQNEIILLDYSDESGCYRVIDNEILLQCFNEETEMSNNLWTDRYIAFNEFSSGAILFDMDSVWVGKVKSSFLYPLLKQKGVKIVTLVHDIIPITHPQYVQESTIFNFMSYIGACLQYANLLIVTTMATKKAIGHLCIEMQIEPVETKIVPLGSDFKDGQIEEDEECVSAEVESVVRKIGKYVLMVGTIEPRKNHKLLLDALENGLAEKGISVIFAGKYGWNVEDLKQRIRLHPLLNKALFFFERPNDKTIKYLYENALSVVFPTFNEGFGLPVVEALQLGTPVMVSDIEVMHEVAGEYAEYFDNSDVQDLVKTVLQLANDDQKYTEKKEMIKNFPVFTWKESAEQMKHTVLALDKVSKRVEDNAEVEQIVLFCNSSEAALHAIACYEAYMPFVKKVLVCTGLEDTKLIETYSRKLEVKAVKLASDVAKDNISFGVVTEIIENEFLDAEFLIATDKIIPLRDITVEDFISDNRYKAYYCADLEKWVAAYKQENFFDKKEKNTLKFLEKNGLTTLMFEARQMQVVSKNIVREILEKYALEDAQGMCFESIYFNYGLTRYPDMFRTCVYTTLGWPVNGYDWEPEELQENFLFEALNEGNRVNENVIERMVKYQGALQEQKRATAVWNAYQDYYSAAKGEMPSFVLSVGEKGIVVTKPTYIQLMAGSYTRIPLVFDKDGIQKRGIDKVVISYWFTDRKDNRITEITSYRRKSMEEILYLSVKAPGRKMNSILKLSLSFGNNEINEMVSLAAYVV